MSGHGHSYSYSYGSPMPLATVKDWWDLHRPAIVVLEVVALLLTVSNILQFYGKEVAAWVILGVTEGAVVLFAAVVTVLLVIGRVSVFIAQQRRRRSRPSTDYVQAA